jgi:release factor glutamine methyltransferase
MSTPPLPTTLRCALAAAQALGLDRLDAQLLLLHVLGRPDSDRGWLLAHDGDGLPAVAADRLRALCLRRAAGEPLAYLVGNKAFYGLQLQVDGRVLVPRPDTETLVDWALEALSGPAMPAGARVLDLGTGSGAIVLALKKTRPALDLSALDASAGALAVARANADRLGLDVRFTEGNWLENVSGHFHLIASNPPYVAEGDSHLAALSHEPQNALIAGPDGLDDLRTIIDQAPAHLHPQAWLLLEHGYDQAAAVRGLLSARGFARVQSRTDLAGLERCSGGCWPG